MNLQPVSALFAELCAVTGADDALRRRLWACLDKYEITPRAAHLSFAASCRQFLDAKRVDGLSARTLKNYADVLRLSELAHLPPQAVNLQARSLTVTGKGNKTRFVYFSTRAKLLIVEYLQRHPHATCLLPGPRQIEKTTRAIGCRAGLERRLVPHQLRHRYVKHTTKI